jgi:hypothetical protein
VTPNCAIARRSQIISYKMLQKPETKKNTKNQIMGAAPKCYETINWSVRLKIEAAIHKVSIGSGRNLFKN